MCRVVVAAFLFWLCGIAGAATPEWGALATWVGGAWESQGKDGAVDRHEFRWMLDGAMLRDQHVVTGKAKPYAGETVYHWNKDQQRFEFTYFNTLGGVSRGHLQTIEGGWVIPESYTGSDGQVREFRTRIVMNGEQEMEWVLEEQLTDGWKHLDTSVLRRVVDEPPSGHRFMY